MFNNAARGQRRNFIVDGVTKWVVVGSYYWEKFYIKNGGNLYVTPTNTYTAGGISILCREMSCESGTNFDVHTADSGTPLAAQTNYWNGLVQTGETMDMYMSIAGKFISLGGSGGPTTYESGTWSYGGGQGYGQGGGGGGYYDGTSGYNSGNDYFSGSGGMTYDDYSAGGLQAPTIINGASYANNGQTEDYGANDGTRIVGGGGAGGISGCCSLGLFLVIRRKVYNASSWLYAFGIPGQIGGNGGDAIDYSVLYASGGGGGGGGGGGFGGDVCIVKPASETILFDTYTFGGMGGYGGLGGYASSNDSAWYGENGDDMSAYSGDGGNYVVANL